jgi:hypothetical protein
LRSGKPAFSPAIILKASIAGMGCGSTPPLTTAPILYNTQLPLPSKADALNVPKPAHDAEYWARVTKGMDFAAEDRFDFATYNHVLWEGILGDKPYPAAATGMDLRQNRTELLAQYQASQK